MATITLGAATDNVIEGTESIELVVDKVRCAGCGESGEIFPTDELA